MDILNTVEEVRDRKGSVTDLLPTVEDVWFPEREQRIPYCIYYVDRVAYYFLDV